MADPVSYAGLTLEQKTFYDRTLLERALPRLEFAKHGQKRPIPKHEGDTIDFRLFNALAAATTPLTEGVTPAGNTVTMTHLTATVAQYGDYIKTTDKLDMAAIDPVTTEIVELLGEQAGLTIDTLARDVLALGTNVLYTGTATARNEVSEKITAEIFRKARRNLIRNRARPLKGGKFLAIAHPDVTYDLMGDAAWVNANQYAGSQRIFDGEVGELWGIRFVESDLAPVFAGAGAGGVDVYATIILGEDAYGMVDISGSGSIETIVKPLGSAGTDDPLNQRASVGWKTMLCFVRLYEARILRVESAATA